MGQGNSSPAFAATWEVNQLAGTATHRASGVIASLSRVGVNRKHWVKEVAMY
jgi:hypothetical protein